ncbi:MAG: hypothetical protein AAFU85_02800, partial [Planctomycetota bacterium]
MSPPHTPERWRQIESVFQDVVDAPRHEHDQRLAELTGEDSELREEVESLLSHDRESTADLTPSELSRVNLSRTIRRAGQVVGEYRLIHPLALNRASEVWCAESVQPVSG